MRRSRFTDNQIVNILKQADAGAKVKDIRRRHEISDETYCNWKSKYGSVSASDLKRLKETEAELKQYKKMYAELAHEDRALKPPGETSGSGIPGGRGRAGSTRSSSGSAVIGPSSL